MDQAHVLNLKGGKSRKDILDFVEKKKCCTLYTFGHQGGQGNAGGAVSYPAGRPPIIIFPRHDLVNTWFDYDYDVKLGDTLKSNCKKRCYINIVACGGTSEDHVRTRQQIANQTGCTVCGSERFINIGGSHPRPWDMEHAADTPAGRPCNVTCGSVVTGAVQVKDNDYANENFERIRWPHVCATPNTERQKPWHQPPRGGAVLL